MVLGLKAMRPVIRLDIQGRLFTGQPADTTYTTQQRLHTPTTSLMSQHPKPIAIIARVAPLAFVNVLLGAFQFSCWVGLP